jgi:3',5'-cyclic AMP phosphodiesterase CpdA
MPIFRFAQITDLHLSGDYLPRPGGEPQDGAIESTRAAIDAINASAPDFVVVTGDLTNRGTREGFLLARRMLDRLHMPYYVLPGNRDIRVEGERELFLSVFVGHGPTDHIHAAWNVGGARCLTLDPWWRTRKGRLQEARPKKKKRGGLAIPPEQLSWLEGELRAHPRAPILIFLHYPLVPPAERFQIHDLTTENDLYDRGEVLALLTGYPQVRAVFCGHQHYNEIVRVPTAGGELLHCMLCATGEYPFMWREVTIDDRITVVTHPVPVDVLREGSSGDSRWEMGTAEDRSASIPTFPSGTLERPAVDER